jgi:hypothetical protein
MWSVRDEIGTPGSIDPTGIKRLVFWLSFVLGNLVLGFSFLLLMVPAPISRDYIPDYIIRTVVACFMLTSIVIAKRVWKNHNPETERTATGAIRIVVFFAWAELSFAIFSILALATYQLFGHNR